MKNLFEVLDNHFNSHKDSLNGTIVFKTKGIMKIKHFAGYGSVNATKVEKSTHTNMLDESHTKLVVKVSGNHEWGLERDDSYDLYNWLIKRFDKGVKDYYSLNINYTMQSGYDTKAKCETCTYTFTY